MPLPAFPRPLTHNLKYFKLFFFAYIVLTTNNLHFFFTPYPTNLRLPSQYVKLKILKFNLYFLISLSYVLTAVNIHLNPLPKLVHLSQNWKFLGTSGETK